MRMPTNRRDASRGAWFEHPAMQPYDAPAAYAPPDPAYSATSPPVYADPAYRADAYRRDPPPSRRRFDLRPVKDLPNGAKILAALFVLGAILSAILGMSHLARADAFDGDGDRDGVFVDRNDDGVRDDRDDGVRDGVGSGVGLIALALASAAVAFGFLTGQSWAWIAGLAVATIALFASLYGIFRGSDTVIAVLGLLLSALALAAHFMPRVQEYYGDRRHAMAQRRYH